MIRIRNMQNSLLYDVFENTFFVNNETFQYFYEMELIIRLYILHCKNTLGNFLNFYLNKMKNITWITIQNCHNLLKNYEAFYYRCAYLAEKRNYKIHNIVVRLW